LTGFERLEAIADNVREVDEQVLALRVGGEAVTLGVVEEADDRLGVVGGSSGAFVAISIGATRVRRSSVASIERRPFDAGTINPRTIEGGTIISFRRRRVARAFTTDYVGGRPVLAGTSGAGSVIARAAVTRSSVAIATGCGAVAATRALEPV
jgi:hypothetical protein